MKSLEGPVKSHHSLTLALTAVVIGTLFVSMLTSTVFAAPRASRVTASVETQPVPHGGDAADDPAIWVNTADTAKSTIIGTDKGGGLAVYDLTGKQIQYLADGELNNVDLRVHFPLGGQNVTLVTASNRSNNSIAIYRVDASTGKLENVAARTISTASPAYGSCMYQSDETGKTYSFLNTKKGKGVVEQYELFDNGQGKVDAKRVRTFAVGSEVEGCVADDETGQFYIAEEDVAIWKYGAEPGDTTPRTSVDTTDSQGHLTEDIEGLAIAYGANGSGYLIASSQGSNSFVLYERGGDNAYIKTFAIADGAVDGVSDTDGIDITPVGLGSAFPEGVFVAQDGHNDDGNQNFKLVPWQRIVSGSTPEPTATSGGAASTVTPKGTAPTVTPEGQAPTTTPGGAAPTVTPDTQPTAPSVPPSGTPSEDSLWISHAELMQLPTSGDAWTKLKTAADHIGIANISDQDSKHDTNTLAAALVYARTGDSAYRSKAALAIVRAIGTEKGGRTLALGRNLVSYVIAADLIDLKSFDSSMDQQFRAWLRAVRTETLQGKTLISTHEDRPNNWGTHAGASRVAVDRYLGDTADLARAAQVFEGWLGNRARYAGFTFKDTSWQCESNQPVGINGPCVRDGHSLDGALPDDMRRGGSYHWPPKYTGYAWEAMQGATVQAELLERAGYPAWQWQNKAMLRATLFLQRLDQEQGGWWATKDDAWQPWLINHAYSTSFPTSPANPGKNMAWTDWMYGNR